LQGAGEFFPPNRHFLRCLDRESGPPVVHTDHMNDDVVTDHQPLTHLPAQYQHGSPSLMEPSRTASCGDGCSGKLHTVAPTPGFRQRSAASPVCRVRIRTALGHFGTACQGLHTSAARRQRSGDSAWGLHLLKVDEEGRIMNATQDIFRVKYMGKTLVLTPV